MAYFFSQKQTTPGKHSSRLIGFMEEGRWIGRWIITLASLHLLSVPIIAASNGSRLFDTGENISGVWGGSSSVLAWYALSSFPLLVVGLFIDRDEKRGT